MHFYYEHHGVIMDSLKPYKKRLYRSRREKMLAGVCGGLAEYFGMDPSLMRILFVVFLLVGGSAILVYLILWLVVPLEPM